jgi:ribosomal protein L37AE/L43A
MKFLSGDFTIADQKKIVQWAKTHGNNVVSRQLQESCHDLYDFDISTPLNTVSFECKKEERFFCYGCGHLSRRTHSVYVFSCKLCGNKFQKYRHLTRDLTGHTAVGKTTGSFLV